MNPEGQNYKNNNKRIGTLLITIPLVVAPMFVGVYIAAYFRAVGGAVSGNSSTSIIEALAPYIFIVLVSTGIASIILGIIYLNKR